MANHKINLTESEIVEIIKKVAKIYIYRPFGVYSGRDLYQHACLFCWAKLHQFDYSRHKNNKSVALALESWLNHIVSNKMKNLFRDNVTKSLKRYLKDGPDDRKLRESLLNPSHIGLALYDELFGSYMVKDTLPDIESIKALSNKLTDEEFDALEAILNEEQIPKSIRDEIFEKCRK